MHVLNTHFLSTTITTGIMTVTARDLLKMKKERKIPVLLQPVEPFVKALGSNAGVKFMILDCESFSLANGICAHSCFSGLTIPQRHLWKPYHLVLQRRPFGKGVMLMVNANRPLGLRHRKRCDYCPDFSCLDKPALVLQGRTASLGD